MYELDHGSVATAVGTPDLVGGMGDGQQQSLESQWLALWRDEINAVGQQLQHTSSWRLIRNRRLRAEWCQLADQLETVARIRIEQLTADERPRALALIAEMGGSSACLWNDALPNGTIPRFFSASTP